MVASWIMDVDLMTLVKFLCHQYSNCKSFHLHETQVLLAQHSELPTNLNHCVTTESFEPRWILGSLYDLLSCEYWL